MMHHKKEIRIMKRIHIPEKVNKKLRDRAGESLSETLVALLISAFALVMLAGAIATASRIVMVSRDKLEHYYDENENLATMETSDGTLTMKFSNSTVKIPVYYYENDVFGTNKTVVAYKKQ